ncbi:hypothetical protein [Methyloglobulus sp.]|uniref:hypothetical protein n=1 Tax=Methyloglobulus sp. TaxID=2518622 RepID=UPI0039898015
MKTIKIIVLSSLIALAMGTFSSAALAEATMHDRIAYTPEDAIDLVLGEIKKAQEAVKAGADGATVYKIIKQAMDYSKEINESDVVDRERSRSNEILKKARTMAKNNSMQGIEEHLEKAAKSFTDLKGFI